VCGLPSVWGVIGSDCVYDCVCTVVCVCVMRTCVAVMVVVCLMVMMCVWSGCVAVVVLGFLRCRFSDRKSCVREFCRFRAFL